MKAVMTLMILLFPLSSLAADFKASICGISIGENVSSKIRLTDSIQGAHEGKSFYYKLIQPCSETFYGFTHSDISITSYGLFGDKTGKTIDDITFKIDAPGVQSVIAKLNPAIGVAPTPSPTNKLSKDKSFTYKIGKTALDVREYESTPGKRTVSVSMRNLK